MPEVLKTFDTLYTLDKSGKVRLFDIYVYQKQETVDFFTLKSCTGLLHGELVYNEKTASLGKQKRTNLEQAIFEAQSIWNSKLDEGYKSKNNLSLKADSMERNIENASIEEIFKILEIKYNTDTHWYPLPMLAEKYKTHQKKLKFPMYAQPKLNGVRCIALYDADLQKVVLVSRGGKIYNIPHIEIHLTPFFLFNQRVILDGELFVHGKPLQIISGAVRKDKNVPTWIEYHIYDMIDDLPQKLRLSIIKEYFEFFHIFDTTHIRRVNYTIINNEIDVELRHNECVEQGYEGLILRDPEASYMVSFRDKCLLKVKEFEDAEFEIIGSEIDPNKTIGESFVFILKNDINDLTFAARPTGSAKEKEEWYKNIDKYIGKKATVRFQERTNSNLPHQGHVRSDLSKCLTIELVDRTDV